MKKIRMKRLISLVLSCAALTMCVAPSGATYKLNGVRLPKNTGSQSSITFIPHKDFGETTVLHFNHACYPWNAASGYSLLSRSATKTHSKTAYPKKDSVNAIYRVSTNDNYVAQTTYYSSNSIIKEADVNINMRYKWANSAQAGCYDVWSVFTHEAGHAVGIGHSDSKSAVMYPTVYVNTTRRTLSTEDKNAAYANYH